MMSARAGSAHANAGHRLHADTQKVCFQIWINKLNITVVTGLRSDLRTCRREPNKQVKYEHFVLLDLEFEVSHLHCEFYCCSRPFFANTAHLILTLPNTF